MWHCEVDRTLKPNYLLINYSCSVTVAQIEHLLGFCCKWISGRKWRKHVDKIWGLSWVVDHKFSVLYQMDEHLWHRTTGNCGHKQTARNRHFVTFSVILPGTVGLTFRVLLCGSMLKTQSVWWNGQILQKIALFNWVNEIELRILLNFLKLADLYHHVR